MLDSILQFGASPFLRAVADLILAQSNRGDVPIPGQVVMIADGSEANVFADPESRFEVAIRGTMDGRLIDEVKSVDVVSRVLRADTEWAPVRTFARRPELRWILWDDTAARHDWRDRDRTRPRRDQAPCGEVARLLDLLLARHEGHALDVTVVPCGGEEGNGDRLRKAVLALARRWRVGPSAENWLRHGVGWLNTLADRVVMESRWMVPRSEVMRVRLTTEPYVFWGIEVVGNQPFWDHSAVVLTEDLAPYRLRSKRMVKAARAALEMRARHLGVKTPIHALDRPELWRWLEDVLREEIAPVLSERVPDADAFACQTMERLRNPLMLPLSWSADLDSELDAYLRPALREHFFYHGRAAALLSAALDE